MDDAFLIILVLTLLPIGKNSGIVSSSDNERDSNYGSYTFSDILEIHSIFLENASLWRKQGQTVWNQRVSLSLAEQQVHLMFKWNLKYPSVIISTEISLQLTWKVVAYSRAAMSSRSVVGRCKPRRCVVCKRIRMILVYTGKGKKYVLRDENYNMLCLLLKFQHRPYIGYCWKKTRFEHVHTQTLYWIESI